MTWRNITATFFSCCIILMSIFLGLAITDLGYTDFTLPTCPFADGVGLFWILIGLAILIIGVWAAIRLWIRIVLKKERETIQQ